ncbi:MAG: hypothetical protein JNK90_08230 [Planctomycetaceae bacterium]|nr:hypothetical protein [Planctomycetaceae bacterium]
MTSSAPRSSVKYPFVPKSTAYLEPGQFWSIPLDNGWFACGRVLQLKIVDGQRDRRQFLAGLIDWRGTSVPTDEAIAGAQLLDHGQVHIKTITENGCEIQGFRSLEQDSIEIPLTLDESTGPRCRLRRGFNVLGVATKDQQERLSVFSTWGYRVIKIRAEKYFGKAI